MRHILAILLLFTGIVHAQQRTNVICIVTDDQARWAMGAYGNGEVITPNMDRLAREGALFRNAFVATPVCSPSRASFFTGRWGSQVGISDWINAPEADSGVGLPPETVTWPEVLKQNGYRTALIGKWHLGTQPQFHPTKHGFDYFYGFLGGGSKPMDPLLEVDGKTGVVNGPVSDLFADAAMRFIEQNASEPFAMCLMFREPHQAYTPVPAEDSEPFKDLDPTVPQVQFIDAEWAKRRTRDYYGAIHAADRNIGRVLAKLDELKLSENTIVLFTSDHGYNIGHHGVYTKGNAAWIAGGVHGPKRPNMFEESIRVPLAIRWPGVVKPGTTIDLTVSNIDTFTTILGMLGITTPPDVTQHGIDFSRALRGEPMPDRKALFAQYDLHNSGLAFMRMIRTPRWKLVRHHMSNGLDELYDLQNDPGETKNLYRTPEHQQIQDELQAKLTAWQQSIDDPILKLDTHPFIEFPADRGTP